VVSREAAAPIPDNSASWKYHFAALEEMLQQPVKQSVPRDQLAHSEWRCDLPRLNPEEVHTAITGMRQIPVLKSIARSFQMASRSQFADLMELADLVRRDPGLNGKILRMVNSSFFALESEIADIEHAMVLLGINRIRLMAQSLGTVQELNQIATGFDLRHLWSHSFACGLMAEAVAQVLGWEDQVHGYSAGLMHDVGKILLSAQFPDAYRQLLCSSIDEGFVLLEAERHVFGMTHAQAGDVFAKEQKLPEEIRAAMAYHDTPDQAPADHAATAHLVFLSNYLSKRHGFGFSGNAGLATDEQLGASAATLCRLAGASVPRGTDEWQWIHGQLAGRLPKLAENVDELVRITFGRSAPAMLQGAG
jgi:putative nucleotidyltransferase with HDIG domain